MITAGLAGTYRVIFNDGGYVDVEADTLRWHCNRTRLVIELLREPSESNTHEIQAVFADTNIFGVYRKDAIVGQS